MPRARRTAVDPLGFLVLSHEKPYQTLRLLRRLARQFPEARIICHHDASHSWLDRRLLPGSVELVEPHLTTQWGSFSVVRATVAGLRALFNAPAPPEWFVLLSGVDYPVKPADQIRGQFLASDADAHMNLVLLDRTAPTAEQMDYPDRFLSIAFWWGQLSPRSRPTWRQLIVRGRFVEQHLLPFHDGFRCYAGSQWFAANRRAAERLLAVHASNRRLRRHYRWRFGADESYFHTILANAPELQVKIAPTHFVRFVEAGRVCTPKTLTIADLGALLTTPAQFARKFDERVDGAVLRQLDRMLGRGGGEHVVGTAGTVGPDGGAATSRHPGPGRVPGAVSPPD